MVSDDHQEDEIAVKRVTSLSWAACWNIYTIIKDYEDPIRIYVFLVRTLARAVIMVATKSQRPHRLWTIGRGGPLGRLGRLDGESLRTAVTFLA